GDPVVAPGRGRPRDGGTDAAGQGRTGLAGHAVEGPVQLAAEILVAHLRTPRPWSGRLAAAWRSGRCATWRQRARRGAPSRLRRAEGRDRNGGPAATGHPVKGAAGLDAGPSRTRAAPCLAHRRRRP